MGYQTSIQWLDGGRILAECGPMRLVISASVGRVPQKDACIRGAKEAFHILEQIAHQRQVLSQVFTRLPDTLDDFWARKMVRSVLAVDQELTPMASVAGTISDGVCAFLARRGMTRAIVNNGGDVALRTGAHAAVKVGMRPDMAYSPIAGVLELGDERPFWGVATSGLEGRSLSCGVASAVTIIAGSASVADAAATSVANASFVEDESVVQRPAEELDEQTDIPGTMVTVQAGPLAREARDRALTQAMHKAELLQKKGVIFGASIIVDGKAMMTDFVRRRLQAPAQ